MGQNTTLDFHLEAKANAKTKRGRAARRLSCQQRKCYLGEVVVAIVGERPDPAEGICYAGDAVAAIISQRDRSASGIHDAGDEVARVVIDGGAVAVLVGDPVAVETGVEVVAHLALGGEGIGAIHILHQAVIDAGGRGENAAARTGEGVAEIVAPVHRQVAGAKARSGDQIDVFGESPLLSQFAIVAALGVVCQGQADGQSTELFPTDNRQSSQFVAVARVGARDRAFPGIGASRSGIDGESVRGRSQFSLPSPCPASSSG